MGQNLLFMEFAWSLHPGIRSVQRWQAQVLATACHRKTHFRRRRPGRSLLSYVASYTGLHPTAWSPHDTSPFPFLLHLLKACFGIRPSLATASLQQPRRKVVNRISTCSCFPCTMWQPKLIRSRALSCRGMPEEVPGEMENMKREAWPSPGLYMVLVALRNAYFMTWLRQADQFVSDAQHRIRS